MPDCNIKCPVVKGCEPCETCPNDKPITTESTNILFDSSGNEPDLTPINFDDILNDLQFDDDLPARRFDVGRVKEDAIQKQNNISQHQRQLKILLPNNLY
ncbi:MAG: hypothetical protein Ct9H90mP28_3610 [Paracoccaceae bacterium]|nr:MAG: hypothetical protein Ct9H90mP28_3610 [Paracoccaceae bacterium]